MNRLPQAVQDFVRMQNAVPVASICPEPVDDGPSPYASHWYRAVAGMLLSGRIAAKHDGLPNLTELNRVCKEANFNQYLCERMARFLIAAKVLKTDNEGRY